MNRWCRLRFNIVATLVEVLLVLTVLGDKLDIGFALITLAALVVYVIFTVAVTEWRIQFRRQANQFDSAANTKAVDSLLNYETVKYFNNEAFEAQRYDTSLQRLRSAQLKSRTTPVAAQRRASSSSLPWGWWPCCGGPRKGVVGWALEPGRSGHGQCLHRFRFTSRSIFWA